MFAGITAIQETIADAIVEVVGADTPSPPPEEKVTTVQIVEGGEDVENFHIWRPQLYPRVVYGHPPQSAGGGGGRVAMFRRLLPFLFLLFLFYWFFYKK